MTINEIKEILSKDNIHIIECEGNWCNAYGYEKSQLKEDLLDYITNLQEELDRCVKANIILDDENTELQGEKQNLQEKINKLTAESTEWDDKIYTLNYCTKKSKGDNKI